MISAILTAAEAWLIAMARDGARVEECFAQHQEVMRALANMLDDLALPAGDPDALRDDDLAALAHRSIW